MANNLRIYDCHLHFGKEIEEYGIETEGANVIFNSLDEYHTFRDKVEDRCSISLIFDFRFGVLGLIDLISNDPLIRAVKIHSRIQMLKNSEYPQIIDALNLLNTKIHVVYDAFYYGGEMEYQPSIENLIGLIKASPNRKFIIAHCGGHRAMDYLLHLKGFSNVYFDLSFSLVYLRGSAAYLDLIHLIKFIPKNRILFGTDYPNISAKSQLEYTLDILDSLNISPEDKEKILFHNANELFRS